MTENRAAAGLDALTHASLTPLVNSQPATVSAVREDGTVNLSYNGSVILKVPCLVTYSNRKIGDRVQFIHSGGLWMVVGVFGPDSSYNAPSTVPYLFRNYLADGTGIGRAVFNVDGSIQNQLLPNMSSVESSIADWRSDDGANTVLAQSNTQAKDGIYSIRVTAAINGASWVANVNQQQVSPAKIYQFSVWVYTPATMNVMLQIEWLDSSSTVVSTPQQTTSVTATTWTQLTITAPSPASAVYANIKTIISHTTIGQQSYIDLIKFGPSAGVYQTAAQQGYSGTGTDISSLLTAWQYHNGLSNLLVSGAQGANNLTMWFSRSPDDSGYDDYVTVSVFPHTYDTLPVTGFTYQTTYTPVGISLQKGHVQPIALPADWVTAIQAATIKGVCVVPSAVIPVDHLSTYCQFSAPVSGGFTAS